MPKKMKEHFKMSDFEISKWGDRWAIWVDEKSKGKLFGKFPKRAIRSDFKSKETAMNWLKNREIPDDKED